MTRVTAANGYGWVLQTEFLPDPDDVEAYAGLEAEADEECVVCEAPIPSTDPLAWYCSETGDMWCGRCNQGVVPDLDELFG